MGRARMVKYELFRNEHLAELSVAHSLLFIGLWTIADREGRLEDRPRRIHIDLFPTRPELQVNSILEELAQAGFIRRYEVDGKQLIQVLQFEKHQHPHPRERPSILPACPDQGITQVQPRSNLGTTYSSPLQAGSIVPSGSIVPLREDIHATKTARWLTPFAEIWQPVVGVFQFGKAARPLKMVCDAVGEEEAVRLFRIYVDAAEDKTKISFQHFAASYVAVSNGQQHSRRAGKITQCRDKETGAIV